MAKKLYPEEDIQAIGLAIQSKYGTSDTYYTNQMAGAIQNIPSGGGGGADVKQTLYFKPGETDQGAGDYIAVSTDGENWNDYLYSDIYSGVVVPGSFIKLLYSSPYFIFEAVDSERQGNSIILTDNVPNAQLTKYHWQNLVTGKIEDADVYPSGENPYKDLLNGIIDRSVTDINYAEAVDIGLYAFYQCKNLVNVSFPNATNIGNSAYYQCYGLTNVNFPNVTTIGFNTFNQCTNLIDINFPNATHIFPYAFSHCHGLTNINFPNATFIGDAAFQYCFNLTDINFSNATNIGNFAFNLCNNLTNINFTNATSIGVYAFQQCTNLTDIIFPNANIIGNYAFYRCTNLTDINFPNATNIGLNAFNGCNNLTNINFPNAYSIFSGAFYECNNLVNAEFPKAYYIYTNAFSLASNLEFVRLGNMAAFGTNVFYGCPSFNTLILSSPEKVATIYAGTFNNCPFNNGNATLYVPNNLINNYLTAPNWSTILAYPNVNILPIEGSIYE